jgi:competence ComEA-like helix-hairpin-helix protein
MPPAERRALLLLLGLGLAGHGVRHWLTRPGQSPGEVQLLAALTPASPAAQRDSSMRLARPLAAGEKIDIETAGASELARLPRVGPRLAKTIVADRETHGPFGALAGLDRVSGVGPGLLKLIASHVVFGGKPATEDSVSPVSVDLNSATLEELDGLPGIGRSRAAAIVQYRTQHGPFGQLEDLGRVPGFGPAALERLREHISLR